MISALIDKRALAENADRSDNAYHIALNFCLEGLTELLTEKRQQGRETHVVFECRGPKEDKELELEFRRICDGASPTRSNLPYKIVFADKRANSAGLQLADLVARPIGLEYLQPNKGNRAFAVLKEKFFCSGGRENLGKGYEGWGLRIIPRPKSEKPR